MYLKVSNILLVSSFIFLYFSLEMFLGSKIMWLDYNIIKFGMFDIKMELILDWVSMSFLSCVLFISGCVFLFSMEYMEGENEKRFIVLVLLFVLSMCLVILSGNVIFILLGWDGLGLVSFVLVIYYQNFKAFNAGMITILSNRIGDVGLLLSIGLLVKMGDWSFNFMEMNALLFFLLMLACITKSAQVPFSAWLPAAMAAPTPVSALVHSSTLVTAGVYLMIRLESSNELMLILLILSGGTMLLGGLSANWEMDFKKIVALSTLSQIGVMMFSCSLGLFMISYFHLLIHAFFKSMMFLCVGALIHSKISQDLRFYGGLKIFMPMVFMGVGISGLSLIGLPFMSGFYSSDMILEKFMEGGLMALIIAIVLISFGMTGSYMMRLAWMGMSLVNFGVAGSMNFNKGLMSKSIFLLSFMGVMLGAMMMWMMISPCLIIISGTEKFLGLCFVALGVWISSLLWWMVTFMKKLGLIMSSLWFLQSISSNNLIKNMFSGDLIFFMDRSWSEKMGPQGMFTSIFMLSMKSEVFRSKSLWLFLLSSVGWGTLMLF
uniref:NADH-ubiquinone oxidoreductase chain 5 n=1 Tax=Songthela hangzhouensis TaxID=1649374 RepID=Q6JT38_9ARAC|nr:NADH dehydrogenase subunit 5 [Songthela hangzhouensis]AAP51140.2 NADH dehydrogenase subunit 5 [Songthela hangzhouensis]